MSEGRQSNKQSDWQAVPRRTSLQIHRFAVMRISLILVAWCLLACGCATKSPQTPLKSGERIVVTFVGSYVPEFYAAIDPSGDIAPPLVGKVHIAGLTLSEAAAEIGKAYQTRAPAFRVQITVSRFR